MGCHGPRIIAVFVYHYDGGLAARSIEVLYWLVLLGWATIHNFLGLVLLSRHSEVLVVNWLFMVQVMNWRFLWNLISQADWVKRLVCWRQCHSTLWRSHHHGRRSRIICVLLCVPLTKLYLTYCRVTIGLTIHWASVCALLMDAVLSRLVLRIFICCVTEFGALQLGCLLILLLLLVAETGGLTICRP